MALFFNLAVRPITHSNAENDLRDIVAARSWLGVGGRDRLMVRYTADREQAAYVQQVHMEQAMLKSFGKIMPVIMPLSTVVVIVLAAMSFNDAAIVLWLRLIAAFCIGISIVTTLTINVPINKRTAGWDRANAFEQWTTMRKRWHKFQGWRGGLFLAAFILLIIAGILQRYPG